MQQWNDPTHFVQCEKESEMTYQALFAAAFALSGAGAMAGELPTYQVDGIVMTPHQQSVLMPSNAQEGLSAGASVYGSPHQIMVLTPRAPLTNAAIATRDGREAMLPNDLTIEISR
jgi:hypothetical protein